MANAGVGLGIGLGVVCGTLQTDMSAFPETVDCEDGTQGQFVSIVSKGTGRLRLCEVEVYGLQGWD